jgi:hypothetical protein
MNRRDQNPLQPSQIRPADEVLRIDLTPHTQDVLRARSRQAHPTAATTRGRPEWRWGRAVDGPRTTSAPLIFGPSDLEPGRGQADAPTPSIADVVKRLKR